MSSSTDFNTYMALTHHHICIALYLVGHHLNRLSEIDKLLTTENIVIP